MGKPRKPWQVNYYLSHTRAPEDFTSEAKAYEFVADLRRRFADGEPDLHSKVTVYQHDGTRWCLHERVDLTEGGA